jgi:hypothetical protein
MAGHESRQERFNLDRTFGRIMEIAGYILGAEVLLGLATI